MNILFSFARRGFSLFSRSLVVMLLVLAQIALLQPVPAAVAAPSAETDLPASANPRPLIVPVPALSLGVPAQVFIGADFTFTATFDNTGADPGYGPFIDLVFPATGMDGNDGVTFTSASYLGAAIPADQVFVQTFPDDDGAGPGTTGCVQHPIAVRPANDPPLPADPNVPRYYQVCGTASDQFVTIILPFGSFVPTQPPAAVTINAHLSNLADLGAPLGITGQAGFRFGATPINDFCCAPFDATLPVRPGGTIDTTNTVNFPRQNVTPILMTLTKAYVGPENETATGPNFPRQFTIAVDIAQGQTITNLVINDTLPSNIQFVSLDSVNPPDTVGLRVLPSTTTPGGLLQVTIPSVTGGAGTTDATLTFTFFVDRAVSGTPIINPNTGVFANSSNTADTNGSWTPLDPRDSVSPATATCGVPCVGIQDQSFAIQKGVANLTDASNSPGDVLEYTLNFQVSDFFGFQGLNLIDVFSDGQRFDASYTPRLTLNGNPNNLAAVTMAAVNVDVACNYTGGPGAECDADDPAANTGVTTVTFNLSDELNARFSNPQLLGGCVNPASANNPPVCSGPGSYNNGPTTGTITFRTIIQDQFTDLHLLPGNSGDPSVDHGDVLENAVNITGSVLNIAVAPVSGQFSPTGQPPVSDDSSAAIEIAFGGLTKSIYAVNGSTTIPQYLSPLDVVTYRLTYTQPASDFEQTTITDYLPLPVYAVTELTTFYPDQRCADLAGHPDDVPLAGEICLGPTDSYYNLNSRGENVPPGNPVVDPLFATDGPSNRLTITYPEYDSVFNISSVIDIMFSVTVTDDPFADGLFLTNQANAAEGTTNAGDQDLDAIVQIQLGEPVLRVAKTAVSTDHVPPADITFQALDTTLSGADLANMQALLGSFADPGIGGVPFSGTIATNDLSTDPNDPNEAFDLFNSIMYGPDNQDLIKYAILIENKGHSQDGAYDITISDTLPVEMFVPTAGLGLNLAIYTGNGNPLTFTSLATPAMCTGVWPGDPCGPNGTAGDADDIFGAGIRVDDPAGPNVPGACQVHSLTSGANIVVVTYDLLLNSASPSSNSIINTATLLGYAGSEGGPNHLPEPLDDDAEVITAGVQLTKALTGTELNVTGNNAGNQAVIGELVTYTLTAKFFELNTLGAQIADTLDPGLAFVDVVSITASNVDTDGAGPDTGLTSSVMTFNGVSGLCTNCTAGTGGGSNPLVQNNGELLTFNFGDVNNTDTDNTVAETVTIVYRAVVTNVATNQAGTTLNNSAQITWTGMPIVPIVVTTPNVTVVEPALTITKNASASSALDAGDPLTYTFTVTSAVTNAYDVTFDDPLPLYFTPDSLPAGDFTATRNPGAVDITGQFELVGSGTLADPYRLRTTAAANLDLLPGDTIDISIDGTISYAAPANSTLTNTATVYWTSLDGNQTDRSTFNPDSDERTGADGVSGALNDYAANSTVVTSVTNPLVLTKQLVSTSESHTGQTLPNAADVAIGEIARFRLIVEVPEGTNNNLQFLDQLPAGLTFLDDGTARMAFVCDDPALPGVCATSSLHSGTDWIINGTSGAVTPTYMLPNGAVSASSTINDDVYSSGTWVYFKFGNLLNNDNDADLEYAVVEFNALVDNSIAGSNDNGDAPQNNFIAYVNLSQSGNTGGPVTLTVREPLINNVNKFLTAPVPTSFDAGNTVSYSVTYSNTGSTDAYDVVLTDNMGALPLNNVTFVSATPGGSCTAPGAITTTGSTATQLVVTVPHMSVGCDLTVVYTADILYSVTPRQIITNTATVNYTSLPGTGTTGNPTGSNTPGGSGDSNGERNHDTSASGGANNDYTDNDTQPITIDSPTLVKSIPLTSEPHTTIVAGNNRVAIGEVVRYRLQIRFPEGASVVNTMFFDNIAAGLQIIDDATDARIAFVCQSSNSCITSTTIVDPDPLTSGLVVSGDETTIAGITPTFNIPDAAMSRLAGSDDDAYVSSSDVYFKLGTLLNNDDDTNLEYIVIEFNVLTLNVTGGTSNQAGTNRANNFSYYPNGVAAIPALNSNSVTVFVAEPTATVTKVLSTTPADAGDPFAYDLTITNTSAGNDSATAFDLLLTDAVDANLEISSVVIQSTTQTATCNGGVTPYTATPSFAGQNVTVNISCLDPGRNVVLRISGDVRQTAPVGENIVNGDDVNLALLSLTYTSLPGTNGTTGNPTGSDTPGGSGTQTGERNGSNGLPTSGSTPLNNYADSAGLNFDLNSGIIIDKQTPLVTNYVIGETVTYPIVVTLPEGVATNVRVTDFVAPGLQYVSYTLNTAALGGTAVVSTVTGGAASGDDVIFDFDNITIADDNNPANNTFTLNVTLRILNILANQNGTTLPNTAQLVYENDGVDTPVTDSTVPGSITILEPVLNITKDASTIAVSPDAGDTVTYTITIDNLAANDSTATAYGVHFEDLLPAYADLQIGTVNVSGAGAATVTDLSNDGANTIEITISDIPLANTVTITYQAVLTTALTPQQLIENTGNIDWTSMPGDNNPGAPDGERDGSGGVNDYNDSDDDTITSETTYPVKSIITTSEAHTSDVTADTAGDPRPLTIGEIIKYRLAVQIPEGTNTNFTLTDVLPTGFTFLNGTLRLGYRSNVDITNVDGTASTDLDSANDGLAPNASPTFLLPAAYYSYTAGTRTLVVDLASPINNDNDGGLEYILVEFDVLVNNDADNNNTNLKNNNFTVLVDGNNTTSNIVVSQIVEPSITNLDKSVTSTGPYDAGETVNYRITYSNAGATDAFEVRVLDTLDPTYFTLTLASITTDLTDAECAAVTPTVTNNSVGNDVDVTISRAPVGCDVVITYSAVLKTAVQPGAVYTNTADLTYTSLPGDGTTPNPTGSVTPGNSGDSDGERNGGGGVNDYNDTDNAQITITAAQPVKSITATSETHTSDATADTAGDPRPVAVGEILRYRLAIAVPEGTSNDFILSDQLSFSGGTPLTTPLLDNTMQVTALNFSAGNFDSLDFGVALEAANGSPVSLYTAGGTPVFTAPFNLVTLTAGNLLTFNLGDIVNQDLNDADVEYIVIEFNVLVNNNANVNLGNILDNDFDVTINGGTSTTSNTVYSRVVEPQLNVTKADDDADGFWVYGQTPVTYTITVEHTGASTATAFDLVVTDTIPAGLTYIPGSITTSAGWVANDTAAPALTWTCTSPACSLPVAGGPINLTYQVTINNQFTTPHLNGDDTAVNTANLTWTSLPGTGTTPNGTGSTTPGGSGASDGERDGSGGVNDYTDTATHTGELVDYYSIGNRVWFDTDNDATMDAGEQPVGDVLVQLYLASDLNTVIASDVTTAGGFYLFDYLVPGDYVVVVAADNFSVDGSNDALMGYWSSQTSISDAGGISETLAPDADAVATDADDNGTLETLAPLSGAVVAQAVTLGPNGLTEPTGEIASQLESGVLGNQGAQPDGRANLTVDFGFYRVEIGNLVYRDENASGTYDSGTDVLLQTIPVELLSGNGLTVLDSTTTDINGEYEFIGWPEGNYLVRVTTPAGLVSTIDTSNPADTTEPDNEVDNNDNGIGIGLATSVSVTSGQLTMDGGETGGTVTVTGGITRDNGLDFGFVYPYALGNRVWFDTDNDATMLGEQPINGVQVALYRADVLGNPTGPVLATDVTANGGYYLFDYLNPGDYVVVVTADNFDAAGTYNALVGYWSSLTLMQANGTTTETPAPDPDDNTDLDDNGTLDTSGGAFDGAVISQAVTLGLTGSTEPTNDDDLEPGVDHGAQPDGRSNLSVDFGFYKTEIGNLVFLDVDRDGAYAAPDTVVQAARVRLYAANNTTEILVGPDGILGTADDAANGMLTNATGNYLFSGLPAGEYIVKVLAPAGTVSTIDSNPQADNDNPDANIDLNDNGDGQLGGTVTSDITNTLTMTPGSLGAANNNSVDYATGTTTNPTVDFGFVEMVAIGNRVWFDTGAGLGGIANDGIQNGTEAGVNGVRVELYTSTGTFVSFDTTDANGDYYFDLLYPGDYYVFIPANQFDDAGDALYGYVSSTSNGLVNDDDDHNADENGIDESDLATNGIRTPVYTLEPNTEPLGDIDAGYTGILDDDNVNLTADFGFLQFVAIGNRVWFDTGAGAFYNNGILDAGETPVDGVTVELYTAAGVFVSSTTTAGGGYYQFDMLFPGQYYVQIPASMFDGVAPSPLQGYVSSLGNGGVNDDDDQNADENGIDTATLITTGIRTPDYDLQPNTEPTGDTGYTGILDDNNVNLTADFGFTQLVAIGNRVWFDIGSGGGTPDDGIQQPGELGVDGVTVELYTSPGNTLVATTTTATVAGQPGTYQFTNLNPGDYYVHIPASMFDATAPSPLQGYVSSTDVTLKDETSDQNVDENGIDAPSLATTGISTQVYTLSVGGETTADDQTTYTGYLTNANVNFTADFGFLQFVAIGNRVWFDTGAGAFYNNGILDAGETPVDGVTVELYTSGGVLVATTTTAGGGYYQFDMLFPGQYYVQIPASMFDGVAPSPLQGYVSSLGNGGVNDDDDQNADENGIDNPAPATNGVSTPIYDLQPNTEPTGDTGYTGTLDDANVNFTADFSFVRLVAIGNRVWFDTGLLGGTPNNGIQDGGELGVGNVDVQLFRIGQNPATDTPVATDITDANGNYEFDLLNPGDYFVHIPASEFQAGGPLDGFFSSLGNGADETSDQDADENGIDSATLAADGISSTPYTLTPDTETTSDNEASYTGYLDDDNVNFTADFGFLQLVAIGNVVWADSGAGGGTANNGIQDGAEPGIPGVDLQLYYVGDVPGVSAPVATTTTAANGYYVFDNLLPGDYFIFIPAVEFQGSATLAGYVSTIGNGTNETLDQNVDENGIDNATPWTNGITSTNYTLQPNTLPTGEPQPNYTGALGDNDVNFTADFGFFNNTQVDLGVTKDDGTTYYIAGGPLTYTITVVNNGPVDVSGVTVSDLRPGQISSWTWACTSSAPNPAPATYGCTPDATNPTPFADSLDLPVGASVTYTVSATVDAAATGTLTNTVMVTPPAGTVDIVPSNDQASDVDNPASLTVDKDDHVTVVAPGSVITYDLLVTNNGAVDLTNIDVTDTLPADVTFQSANPAPTTSPAPGTPGGVLTWTGRTLLVGANETIQVTVRVNDTPSGASILNTVTVEDTTKNVSDNDDDQDTLSLSNAKAMTATSEAFTADPNVAIGEILTYQISLNIPAGTMTNLRALDLMDAGLAFVRCVSINAGTLTTTLNAADPTDFTPACNPAANPTVLSQPVGDPSLVNQGRRVEFNFGDVTSTTDQTLLVTYEAIVLDVDSNRNGVNDLNNSVTWTWTGGTRTASTSPVQIVEPELSIDKNATPSTAPLQSVISFTLDIAHTVASTANAYDVVATDFLPSGLAYVPGSATVTGLAPTSINFDPVTHVLTFVWDVFPLGQTASITFQAVFVGPAPTINTANVAWTSLPLDPAVPGGPPTQLSAYNVYSTERWYDPVDAAGINDYGAAASVTITEPRTGLPKTGFAPGKLTILPAQPAEKRYASLGQTWLEIPALGLQMPIVGVPINADGWDLTWLSSQAGYLEGTTYPGQIGTTGITGHTTLADGTPGPFRKLDQLMWGSQIILHMDGYRYVYEVRELRTVLPKDYSVFKNDGYTWMTLLTCKGYVPWLDTYNYRLAVRAVLLSVEADPASKMIEPKNAR